MKTYQSGIVTLSVLLLLTSLLLLMLLFDDDILRFHSAIKAQRQIYLQQTLALQQQSQAEKQSVCNALSVFTKDKVMPVFFPDQPNGESIQHSVFCRHIFLIYPAPTQKIQERQFETFIQRQHLPLFKPYLETAPTKPTDKQPHLYWFTKKDTEWELQGHFSALVVAEGDLHISGAGKISGAIVTAGRLTYDPEIEIVYKRNVVATIAETYSQWQLEEKSWNDFYRNTKLSKP